MIIADGAHFETAAGAIEEHPNRDDKGDGNINERIFAEQNTADYGQTGQHRQVEMRCRHDLLADKTCSDQSGKADAENSQRQAGRDLIDRKAEREDAEDRRQRHAGEDAAQRADSDRAGGPRAGEAAGRTHNHHSLDAEIEHAGALDNEFAGRRQQQRS